MITRERAIRCLAGYSRGIGPKDIEAMADSWTAKEYAGVSSCVFHEVYEWASAQPKGSCDICGGDILDGGARHELCRLRQRDGLPTPRLDQSKPCGCQRCQPNTRYA